MFMSYFSTWGRGRRIVFFDNFLAVYAEIDRNEGDAEKSAWAVIQFEAACVTVLC